MSPRPPSRDELALHYPFGDELPPPGGSLAVAPGVRWIRMALPFALDHINLWLLRDRIEGREGWTVVDCCIDRPEARAQWEQVVETQLEGLPILRVIVTHMHPDHIGLAHWLCERWSTPGHACRLWVSATDYFAARVGASKIDGFGGEGALRFFASHGLNAPEDIERMRGRTSHFSSLVPDVPRSFRRLIDGGMVEIGGHLWRCISGQGHSPDHMALYCETLGVLISGDMLLPRISTNVSVHENEPEFDALAAFLTSIDKFLPLPAATRVLPSHGKPFSGLHERVAQLHQHHEDRLAEVMAACRQGPQSALQIVPVLFKRALDSHQMMFALGESVAHLHALWHGGQLVRERGSDGVWRFRAAAA